MLKNNNFYTLTIILNQELVILKIYLWYFP